MSKFELDALLKDFDATSLYPAAVWDENRICPEIEIGYAYLTVMKDEFVQKFISGNFNEGSVFLKVMYFISKDMVFQHLPVEKKFKKIEVKGLRIGYIIDILTSLDIKKIIRTGNVINVINGLIKQKYLQLL